MSYKRIKLDYEGSLAVLTLNHPEVMNAVGVQMLEDLYNAVRDIAHQGSKIRCLMITGEGRGFCAGAHLTDEDRKADSMNERAGAGDILRGGYHPVLYAMRDLEMPIVTAINGAAVGIGMSFALMGDIVCAANSAYFLQAFARIGLVPDGGSTFVLPRLIGWGRAMELSLLAERLPAEKAKEWGLVNFLFQDDELMAGAHEIAERLSRGPKSLSLVRKAYWQTWGNSYESQLDLEAKLQNEAGRSADSKEGIAAFQEKRAAKFTGQ